MWENIDGSELALLRFAVDVELIDARPDDVRFEQAEGWAVVESPSPDFKLTFRQGDRTAVCDYNPFFIECEDA